MTLYFAFVFGFYFVALAVLRIGWIKIISKNNTLIATKENFISIIVATRNEADNIDDLLSSLSKLNYPENKFEVILVDDHSEDGSLEKSRKWLERFSQLKIISLPENKTGKKAALAMGITLAGGEIIATTDADCLLPNQWLRHINIRFQGDSTKMGVGAVVIQANKTFFSELQALEFASVIGTGLATLGLNKPTMCNGANLSFRKKVFDEVNGYSGNEHIASGDDEFLMRKISTRYPNSVQAITSTESVVITQPQASVNDFVRQRLRWASKWKANSSLFAQMLAVFIFLAQVSWIYLLVESVIHPNPILFLILFAKVITDLIFPLPVFRFLKVRVKLLSFVALQFLYPLYVLFIGFFSQWKDHQWKGR